MGRKAKGWKVWVEKSGLRWRCRWTGAYGRGQEIFDFADDALELRIARRREFQRRDAGLPATKREIAPDFPAFKAKYLRWLGQRRATNTVKISERFFGLWMEFAKGDFFPSPRGDKSGRTAADFSDWLLDKYRPNGVVLVLSYAKAAFRWAYKHGHIEYDPFQFFEFPPREKVGRILSQDQIIAILRALPEDCRRAFYFVVHTGLRISEALWLEWASIYTLIDTEIIDGKEVKKEVTYLTVKKSKTRRGREGTKTMALHPNVVRMLGPRGEGRVFRMSDRKLHERLQEATTALGIGRVRWHDLRHTWATNFMENAKDLKALMDAGGWESLQSAMVYQHSTSKRVKATANMPSPIAPEDI